MADDRSVISAAVQALAERAVEATRTLTRDGEGIDEHHVVVERVAYAATEARVIAERARAPEPMAAAARIAMAELAAAIPHRLAPIAPLIGLRDLAYDAPTAAAIAAGTAPAAVEEIGAIAIAAEGRLIWPLDEILTEVRANVRAF